MKEKDRKTDRGGRKREREVRERKRGCVRERDTQRMKHKKTLGWTE